MGRDPRGLTMVHNTHNRYPAMEEEKPKQRLTWYFLNTSVLNSYLSSFDVHRNQALGLQPQLERGLSALSKVM